MVKNIKYGILLNYTALLHCKHGEKYVTSLVLRKLIDKLLNEDKLSIGYISKAVEDSK